MTITFRPGQANWDYVSYTKFRSRLAKFSGFDLAEMRGYGGNRDWEDYPTPLKPLLNASDVHGFIAASDCEAMLPRLKAIAYQWQEELARSNIPEDGFASLPHAPKSAAFAFDHSRLRALIEGMEHCAQHGCALAYG